MPNINTKAGLKNGDIARALLALANALELRRENRFKVRAYRRAARTIQAAPANLAALIQKGEVLPRLPGIGEGISQLVREFVTCGKMAYFDQVKADIPEALVPVLDRPGLDPRLVQRAYRKLKIDKLEHLEKKLAAGDVERVLGHRLARSLHRGFSGTAAARRFQLTPLLDGLLDFVRGLPGVTGAMIGGACRRKEPVVSEIVIGVIATDFTRVVGSVAEAGFVAQALGNKTTVGSDIKSPRAKRFNLNNGLLLTLLPIPPDQSALGLLEATGSPRHWNALRKLRGFAKLKRMPLNDEAAAYRALGLNYVEPELREHRGELAAATSGTLPRLIKLDDIRGDLHMHTTASDGVNTLAEMARAARHRGYEYIAITDHSKRLKLTNGLDEKRLLKQIAAIDRLNARLEGFRILKSSEVDILEDGKLDFDADILSQLDLTTCSIHSRFNLSRAKQTTRILKAMDNPNFTTLGHATGRLLLSRDPYPVDIKRILRHAADLNRCVEINSNPYRLDICSDYSRMAIDLGVTITISTDAHSIGELDNMVHGIDEARRGWIKPADVLNTMNLKALLVRLRRPR